jgi:ribosomal protein S18 acetylase RimI-like enzyme
MMIGSQPNSCSPAERGFAVRSDVSFRTSLVSSDVQAIRRMVTATGFFRADEIGVAIELAQERLSKGPLSGYEFVLAELAGEVVGYACYGLIPCTLTSYDLYWIVVAPSVQGRGIGKQLVRQVESHVKEQGGLQIYVETSGRPQYEPTRNFYARCGYSVAATLPNFYAPNDDKIVWQKILNR